MTVIFECTFEFTGKGEITPPGIWSDPNPLNTLNLFSYASLNLIAAGPLFLHPTTHVITSQQAPRRHLIV
jgi:hypothetical protein